MALRLITTVANSWKFTIYSNGDCVLIPSGDLLGDGDKGIYSIPKS